VINYIQIIIIDDMIKDKLTRLNCVMFNHIDDNKNDLNMLKIYCIVFLLRIHSMAMECWSFYVCPLWKMIQC